MKLDNFIQIGIFLIAIGSLYFMMRRDNRISNEEVFDKSLTEQKNYMSLKQEVEIQKMLICQIENTIKSDREDVKEKLTEISQTLKDLYDKINNLIINQHTK